MLLSLHNDKPSSTPLAEGFQKQNVLERLRTLDARVRRKGLASLDPEKSLLIRIGMEIDPAGRVTKNSYGVFHLPWRAEEAGDWPERIEQELAEIKARIRQTHGVSLRYVIWAGMGGSAEDKAMYNAAGLLRRGPRLYVLDSTDPAKLKAILDDMTARSRAPLGETLKSTLVVGMALGMTSYEPVLNLEKLKALYERHKIDSTPNFLYMTLPGSLLDQFGKRGGYRKVELQLDGGNSTSGRHSSPLTRGSLYPLGLASVPLREWMQSATLPEKEIEFAWRLSAFLSTQAANGRDKVTLLLPRAWAGAGVWTKQDFEESLGKSEDFGLKIVIGERVKLANYHPPRHPAQDRCFLAVHVKPFGIDDGEKISALRRAGYPVAVLTLASADLARYMQFIHYAVFGVAYLNQMNFVTQPGVELYKAITNRLHAAATASGGIEQTQEWRSTFQTSRKVRFGSSVTFYYDRLPAGVLAGRGSAPELYASLLRTLTGDRRIEYAELTFFGDTRYCPRGRALRKTLDKAGDLLFRVRLKMPVDIYEGPAMNHSYHEMIIGHGRCLSTVLLPEKAETIPAAGYTADYHRAQFLATQMALAERGRYVVSVTVKDLEKTSLDTLAAFFKETAAALKTRGAGSAIA